MKRLPSSPLLYPVWACQVFCRCKFLVKLGGGRVKLLSIFFTGVFLFAAGVVGAEVAHFQNPLAVRIADPQVLRTNEREFRYYLSGTGLGRYGSRDLVHWQRLDQWTSLEGLNVTASPWAAECIEHDGRFYFHFSMGVDDGPRRIHIAESDCIDGEFLLRQEPLWEDEFTWIDSHIFLDDDGTPWLFVTNDSKSQPSHSP